MIVILLFLFFFACKDMIFFATVQMLLVREGSKGWQRQPKAYFAHTI